MPILIAEDNEAQRRYLSELLTDKFPDHAPVIEASDGEAAVRMAIDNKASLSILDIQMPKLSGVKAARSIWKEFPEARIIFWTQFPHEIYINEIRKIVRSTEPQPTYGFIHKNNPEDRFLRFVAAVLEDGADMIDPAFKDSFQRPSAHRVRSRGVAIPRTRTFELGDRTQVQPQSSRCREPARDALRKALSGALRRHRRRRVRQARIQRPHARVLSSAPAWTDQ
jgi:DNA-binding NarL/FixJ family response regulator